MSGSLTVVGTGIRLASQVTPEAAACITSADRVLFAVSGPAHAIWIRRLRPDAISLEDCYGEGKPRRRTYSEMADRIVAFVRDGFRTCAAFYGHPGVFAQPSHTAIARTRQEGFPARMLPGISAEDCLFADLGLNPGQSGCQSYEASDFLLSRRRFDPTSTLILWQVGLLGESSVRPRMSCRPERLRVLARTLQRHYPDRHRVALYEAAAFPGCDSVVEWTTLAGLPRKTITPAVTLYVPPLRVRGSDPKIARWFREG